jgi:hypothetical protein
MQCCHLFAFCHHQSSDASAGERGTFHSNTLAFNGAAEKVAKGLQGGYDDVRVTPHDALYCSAVTVIAASSIGCHFSFVLSCYISLNDLNLTCL